MLFRCLFKFDFRWLRTPVNCLPHCGHTSYSGGCEGALRGDGDSWEEPLTVAVTKLDGCVSVRGSRCLRFRFGVGSVTGWPGCSSRLKFLPEGWRMISYG